MLLEPCELVSRLFYMSEHIWQPIHISRRQLHRLLSKSSKLILSPIFCTDLWHVISLTSVEIRVVSNPRRAFSIESIGCVFSDGYLLVRLFAMVVRLLLKHDVVALLLGALILEDPRRTGFVQVSN